ncbi:ribosome biogenesis protein Nop53p [[Candida] anglica]|uniref:Ribosome biogenesis protein NOP53 n=1 Tax=[Candida] anglica TaxID=148631 RepID=A0ABP0EJ80_9ASCO
MEVNRPQTKSQRSRKGKKAWRKNVDIDDVQAGLHDKSEHERIFGKESSDDFVLDNEGDSKLVSKNQPKKLKSLEILDKRSKFPALNVVRNNKKIQGVDRSEVHRLMKLSGRVNGITATEARIAKNGITSTKVTDLWAEEEETVETPEILKKFSSSEWTKAKNMPKTLNESPIMIKSADKIISGKSYNPSFESWKALLNEEFTKESGNEEKRQLLKEHQEKIKNLIANLNDNEEEDSSDDEESEKKAAVEEVEEVTKDFKLSINKPTQVKIKTKTQRNKALKHKQREELQMKLKELKHQIHELNKLEEYEVEVEEKLSNKRTKREKAPSKLFKYTNVNDQLEIKLSDEISDSLRKLKPEGNLLYDQMRNLQDSGKIEARIPVSKKRKYTPKITEKWTYKDFK